MSLTKIRCECGQLLGMVSGEYDFRKTHGWVGKGRKAKPVVHCDLVGVEL